jgi:glutathione S-transferase
LKLTCKELKSPQVPFLIRPISKAIAGRVESSYLRKEVMKQWDWVESQLDTSSGKFLAGESLSGAVSYTFLQVWNETDDIGHYDGVSS